MSFKIKATRIQEFIIEVPDENYPDDFTTEDKLRTEQEIAESDADSYFELIDSVIKIEEVK